MNFGACVYTLFKASDAVGRRVSAPPAVSDGAAPSQSNAEVRECKQQCCLPARLFSKESARRTA